MRSAPGIALALAVAGAAWAAAPEEASAKCRPPAGDLVTETRAVRGFHEIGLSAPAHLVVKQGAREALVVRADRRLMPYLKTTVSSGRLDLDLDTRSSNHDRFECTHPTVFEVTVVKLSALDVSGAGSAKLGPLQRKQFALDLSGAAEVEMERLVGERLDIDMSGAATVRAAGKVARQSLRISGTGRYKGEQMASDAASISIAGTGSAQVNASKELDVSISGVGDVQYLGNPKITRTISGMGSLARLKR
jgi:Putative auto-transporter adhesin, head GIN domain